MKDYHNVFEAISNDGHDECFVPHPTDAFEPTSAAPGTREKIDLLRDRVASGFPLWHDEDRGDYGGLIGAVAPRHA